MNRDEILRRNREFTKKDEGVQYIEMQSRRFGEVGLCVFFIILILYKLAKGFPANDLLAVFWGYLGVGAIYKYKITKTTQSFVTAVCGIIAAVTFTIAYVARTW